MKLIIISLLIVFISIIFVIRYFLAPVANISTPGVFVVPEGGFDVFGKLEESRYVRNATATQFLYLFFAGDRQVESGGYRLNKTMNAWQVVQKISGKPDLVWVFVREGLRKEQVGQLLAKDLGWSQSEEKQWNEVYTHGTKPEYAEGVYFPDTYLLPRDETVEQIAARFIDRFNEKFAPYLDQFTPKNIRWPTGIKIASLIQREAGGAADMKLISGIIWNRLDIGMKLEIDATLQYMTGNPEDGWWRKVDVASKKIDSPYNTYLYKGLPPTPIASPGLLAIEAALNPEETDCLFYLHGSNGQIHCARDYSGHKENIKKYLSY